MLTEIALVAMAAILIVRAMIRSSERRIMDECRRLSVRHFEVVAAAVGKTPDELLEAVDEDEDRHWDQSYPT